MMQAAANVVPMRRRSRPEMPKFLRYGDVMEMLDISKASAYRIIRELNKELQEKGYKVFAGRVPRTYLIKRYGGE